MENNTQLPVEVAEEIEAKALELYPPMMCSPRHMVQVDMNADSRMRWSAGATAYATKLHQAEQENAELRRQNDKMKEMATGWRPLLEEVLSKHGTIILMHDSEFHEKIKKFLYGE